MTSLNERLINIGISFGGACDACYHYEKPAGARAPYVVWAEGGEPGGFSGNNRKGEQAIGGTLDLYTLTEFDPLVDALQTVLESQFGGSWALEDVLYEDETKLIHYAWRWETA